MIDKEILFKMKKHETYTKLKLLGEGSFGKAYLVECNSDKVLGF